MTEPGLCASCTHAQVIVSSKGSTFYMCRLSEVDPSFRRYPVLPVIECPGYVRAPGSHEEHKGHHGTRSIVPQRRGGIEP
jgi:hypothetical protein